MKYIQDISWYKSDYLNHNWIKKELAHYFFNFQKGSLAGKDIKNIIDGG